MTELAGVGHQMKQNFFVYFKVGANVRADFIVLRIAQARDVLQCAVLNLQSKVLVLE